MKLIRFLRGNIAVAAAVLCALACAACIIGWGALSRLLPAQREYERWRGENSMSFGQVSCFMPVDEKATLEQIYTFRNEIQKKLAEAALESKSGLFNDAWCTFGKVTATGEHGSGKLSVTAVGGSFFDFHPLTLISGSYFSDKDLMRDRVLLDEDSAWLLFGGRELEGMPLTIEGKPFVVAGVIAREDDSISKKAYSSGMGIYMSYEAYMRLYEQEDADPSAYFTESGISCYELTMAEPVSGMTYALAQEKFPLKEGVLVNNAQRYSVSNVFKILRDFTSRSMQTQGVILPYWENAARSTEDRCALLLLLSVLTGIYPAVFAIRCAVFYGRRGAGKISAHIPEKRAELEEAVRVRQRRRWEKQHPGWK